MIEYNIRPTIPSDLARLMGLDHSLQSDHVWQLELRRETGQAVATFREVRLPRPIALDYPHNPFALADEFKKTTSMLTAVSGPDIIGYVAIIERAAVSLAWVTDLVVAPQARRQGVGSALLLAAQDWALEREHRSMMMEMQAKNLPAIRLAQKHGYDFCGYNDHYYLNQDVALFFARALK
jgi:GNAT superfamily N-acetyltransferase